MNDFVTSLIRTYVPVAVGTLVSWLVSSGIDIDPSDTKGVVAFMTAALIGIYYLVARILERNYPPLGFLLGSTKKPEYKETK